jgi:hypothetical protein
VGLNSLKSLNLTNVYPNNNNNNNKNNNNKNNNKNNKVKSKPLELFELAGKKQVDSPPTKDKFFCCCCITSLDLNIPLHVRFTEQCLGTQRLTTGVISSLDLQIVAAVDFGRQEQHEKYPELNILRDKICRSAYAL